MSISYRRGKQHLWYGAAAVAVLAPSYWLGWIMSSSGDASDATATATAFLEDLVAGRFEAAYARTSTGFQSSNTMEHFRDVLKRNPMLEEAEPIGECSSGIFPVNGCSTSESRCCQIWIDKGNRVIALTMRVDRGQWKVSACLVQNVRAQTYP
jgi:hypothetical protein